MVRLAAAEDIKLPNLIPATRWRLGGCEVLLAKLIGSGSLKEPEKRLFWGHFSLRH
jgi:hypothetical protein